MQQKYKFTANNINLSKICGSVNKQNKYSTVIFYVLLKESYFTIKFKEFSQTTF